jgi:hypothetical protein
MSPLCLIATPEGLSSKNSKMSPIKVAIRKKGMEQIGYGYRSTRVHFPQKFKIETHTCQTIYE